MAEGASASDPVVEIRDLRVKFGARGDVVDGVSLTIARGEVLALVGESGSGKSLTARSILGLLPPGAKATGSVRLGELEVIGATERELTRIRGGRVGMVFQDPQAALNPVRTVGWQLRQALRARGRVSRRSARGRSLDLLRQVDMPDPEQRLRFYPHQLSGGQKQRVVLALALAGEPELLLADEPTTALDVTVQASILRLLDRLRRDEGTAILLVTHNMGVVASIADRVAVMRDGEILEQERTRDLFERPSHRYTRVLLDAVPALPGGDTGEERHGPRGERGGETALSFDSVGVIFAQGGRTVEALNNVTLAVPRGGMMGIVGGSGSGKTTLGRVAAGLVRPTAGVVKIDGRDLRTHSAADLREMRKALAFVPQDPAGSLDPRLSVEAAIEEPLLIHRFGDRATRRARVDELIDLVRLPGNLLRRRPGELSGGQRQRVALARSIALKPRLLIADEPTSALDVSIQADILALFVTLRQQLGFAGLFISHDLAVVYEVTDTVAVLNAGAMVEVGDAADVLTEPEAPYTRELLDAIPRLPAAGSVTPESTFPRGADR